MFYQHCSNFLFISELGTSLLFDRVNIRFARIIEIVSYSMLYRISIPSDRWDPTFRRFVAAIRHHERVNAMQRTACEIIIRYGAIGRARMDALYYASGERDDIIEVRERAQGDHRKRRNSSNYRALITSRAGKVFIACRANALPSRIESADYPCARLCPLSAPTT